MFLGITSARANDGIDTSVKEFEDVIFQSSVSELSNIEENRDTFDSIHADFSGTPYNISDTDPNRMPFFKQIRLRSTYKYREIGKH